MVVKSKLLDIKIVDSCPFFYEDHNTPEDTRLFKLRQYQESIINEVRDLMTKGNRSILIVAPTGSGKTLLTAYMLGMSARKGLTSWFSVHRRELITQSADTFDEMNIPHGIISPNHSPSLHHQIQIVSIQTVARRIKNLKPPKLMIWDEAHHISSKSWDGIFDLMPDTFHVGLTATPIRLDGRGLKKWFPKLVNGPTVEWLINLGYLSPFKIYAPKTIDTKGVHVRGGDYRKEELEMVVDKPKITGDAIIHYRKLMNGKRAVVFCASIKHSNNVADAFNAEGIKAKHVDGETPIAERDQAIRDFREGRLSILSNVDLFGEGFDIPAMEGAILLRPTKSTALYLQQCGRALRPYPGKEFAIILDHAGNCMEHGMPDEVREWTLEDRARNSKPKDAGATVRVCGKCLAAQPSAIAVCKFCGYVFPVKSRKLEEVEGDLEEIKAGQIKKQNRQDQGRAKSFHDLVGLGKQRGYKNPYAWAKFVFNYRQKQRLGR